jgi:hypothetical protein
MYDRGWIRKYIHGMNVQIELLQLTKSKQNSILNACSWDFILGQLNPIKPASKVNDFSYLGTYTSLTHTSD